MELELQQLTTEVRRIATEAGNFLRKERQSFSRESVVEKHAHDYVSYVDKESERLLVGQLSALLPEAGFIAEEGSGVYKDEAYCWVIDPLDGTTNYIHDNAPYCVSIALRSRTELLFVMKKNLVQKKESSLLEMKTRHGIQRTRDQKCGNYITLRSKKEKAFVYSQSLTGQRQISGNISNAKKLISFHYILQKNAQ